MSEQDGKRVMEVARRRPMWQRVFVSDAHCGSGCTLGDIIGHTGLFLSGITIAGTMLWPAYIVDFSLAFLLGIAFQYFSIRPMKGLPPRAALKEALKADTLSILAFEIGLFAWMALMEFVFFHPPLKPNQPEFWLCRSA